MTAGSQRALGDSNDTARRLCLMHEINETTEMFLDVDPPIRPSNIVDTALCLADHAADEQVTRDHLVYIAAQALAWALTIDRRRAEA